MGTILGLVVKGGPRMKKVSASGRRRLQQCGAGISMNVGTSLPYPVKQLSRVKEMSKEARVRMAFLDFAKSHPVAVTCRRFGISRSTYYRWKNRFNPHNMTTLENKSKRPKNVRKPMWSVELIEVIRILREEFPVWGKAKLVVLVRQRGFEVSESTVGRILGYLKRRGVLREPVKKVKARSTPRRRVYATRKPADYEVKAPGDLVQIDTLDIRPEPGCVRKQFSAGDVKSKWAFADVRSAATSSLAKEFLEDLIRASPFKIRGVQVDGGSEFYGDFEEACKELGIRLFALPPRSPKLNGVVERLNRTFREEFWACYDGGLTLEEIRPALKRWTSEVYNQLRPHQNLGYMTPAQYLETLGLGQCIA